MLRRRGALLASGLAFALALTACDNAPPTSDDPVPGGELRVAVRDLGSLDSATAAGRGALLVLSQLFDPLTTVDPKTGSAGPAAASAWTTAPDGLSVTFTIAPAKFHDGTPVTPADFKAAFDRITRKATNSDVAFQFEAVKGFHQVKIAGTAQTLAGVVAGPTTLKFLLDRPFQELPLYLAHPALGPLSKSMAANPAAMQTHPIGNGAFKMAADRSSDSIMLQRYDDHAGSTALLERIQVRLVADGDQGWRDFLAGRTDVAEVPAEAIAGSQARAGRSGFGPFWAALYYGMNLKNPNFAKAEVRKALSLAIDRKQIAEVVYGGTKEEASGIIPRGIRGFSDDACADCVRDTERARSLIAAAFGGRPPEMIIDHLNASPSAEVAQAIAGDLQEVGLKVALRAHNSTDYLKLLQAGGHQIAELGWLAEVPSPDGFLAQQLRTGSPNNHTGFADGTFDTYIDRARAAANETDRLVAYSAAEKRAFELMPMIPIVFFRNHVGVASRVRGLRIDGAGIFDATGIWIAAS
ncbi:MAG: ABC transporter substrate-binding protein [Actinomycetota bacterium]